MSKQSKGEDIVVLPVEIFEQHGTAQKYVESLLRENRVLNKHNEHLVRETVKMAADVAAIQRAHDEQKLRLYTEIRYLKEQNAQLQQSLADALLQVEELEEELQVTKQVMWE